MCQTVQLDRPSSAQLRRGNMNDEEARTTTTGCHTKSNGKTTPQHPSQRSNQERGHPSNNKTQGCHRRRTTKKAQMGWTCSTTNRRSPDDKNNLLVAIRHQKNNRTTPRPLAQRNSKKIGKTGTKPQKSEKSGNTSSSYLHQLPPVIHHTRVVDRNR